MADISKLSRVVDGYNRNVNLSENSLVVGSLKVGSSSPTELTKAIVDKLVAVQSAADVDGTFDSRYHTKTDLASPTGAANIGTGMGFTVEQRLDALDSMAGTAQAAAVTFDPTNTDFTATQVQQLGEEINSRIVATELVANAAIPSSQKGANNGVATLDGGGKVPASQLPSTLMTLEGSWDASTNTPTLANGTGDPGSVYETIVSGSVDFGDGAIPFLVGDWVVYGADGKWYKSVNSNNVNSVNGQTGTITLNTDNILEGTTNKYFTENAAKDAAGAAATDSNTIDFTYDSGAKTLTAEVKDNSIDASKITTSMVDGVTIVGGNGTPLSAVIPEGNSPQKPAGEAMAADTSFAVRFAVSGETAGRVYKATRDASSANLFFAIGLAKSVAGVSAGGDIAVTTGGTHTLGANDTPFSSGDIGKPVFITTSGGFSVTPPTGDNEASYIIGIVEDTTKVLVQPQLLGIN